MSSLGSLVSDIGAATGSRGSYSGFDITKNRDIQGSLTDLISNYKSNTAQDSTDLNSFISNYLKQSPQAADFTGQETGSIGSFYNGDVARQLAQYRAQQSTLGDEAVHQALMQNRGNMNRSILGGGGSGDSSWANRYGIGVASQLDLSNALNNLGQERADYGTVLQNQISLAGRRQALMDALTQRSLIPMQARSSVLGGETSALQGLAGINNTNNQFGVQYNPTGWELAGNVVGDLASIGMQAAPMVAGLPPMGGAAPSAGAMGMMAGGAGPVNNAYAASMATPAYPSGFAGAGLSNSLSTLPWNF